MSKKTEAPETMDLSENTPDELEEQAYEDAADQAAGVSMSAVSPELTEKEQAELDAAMDGEDLPTQESEIGNSTDIEPTDPEEEEEEPEEEEKGSKKTVLSLKLKKKPIARCYHEIRVKVQKMRKALGKGPKIMVCLHFEEIQHHGRIKKLRSVLNQEAGPVVLEVNMEAISK